jgi:hypothetical protein
MIMKPVATILIPTTGDRSGLLEHALWSIQRQTRPDWEVFIMGDGVSPLARERYLQWERDDARVRFFDHPKHPRRGEEYRDEALRNHARGEIVCYLCDRDFLLPHHLEVMTGLLREADFAHTLPVSVLASDVIASDFDAAIWLPEERFKMGILASYGHGLPLPMVGHRLDFYKTLNPGWSTTPEGQPTDIHMWSKFLNHPGCRFCSCHVPTVVHLPRGTHPGWPPEQRLTEMLRWTEKMQQPDFYKGYLESIIHALVDQKLRRGSGTLRREISRRFDSRIIYYRHRGRLRDSLMAAALTLANRILRAF